MQINRPIVLVHGLIGTLQVPDLTPHLGTGKVLAPDLLGYGTLRDAPPSEVHISAQVAHLRAILAAHFGDEAVNLVGHSTGGAVAALFAHAHPDRVHNLVSVEGNFTLNDAFWSASVARMSGDEATRMLDGFRQDPKAWLGLSGISGEPRHLAIATHWLQQQPASTLRAMAQSIVAVTGAPAYAQSLRAVFARHPVHLVAGARSRDGWDVPSWALQQAASLTVIPDTGHLMMIEQPAAFAATLRATQAASSAPGTITY